jgi:branched-chain amino acid transport system ATP-binding protein
MSPSGITPLLQTVGIGSGYDGRKVISGISIEVSAGEIVALVGHNGSGKSTFLKAIFGVLPLYEGKILVDGAEIKVPSPRNMLLAGIGYVPQGHRIFDDMLVTENLEIATLILRRNVRQRVINQVLELFPVLVPLLKRRAGTLSGGEKQALALANGMLGSPRLLLLDEPSLGLAPQLSSQVLQHIVDLSSIHGTAFVVVEQRVKSALQIAQRVYVLKNGSTSYAGTTSSLNTDEKLREVYL